MFHASWRDAYALGGPQTTRPAIPSPRPAVLAAVQSPTLPIVPSPHRHPSCIGKAGCAARLGQSMTRAYMNLSARELPVAGLPGWCATRIVAVSVPLQRVDAPRLPIGVPPGWRAEADGIRLPITQTPWPLAHPPSRRAPTHARGGAPGRVAGSATSAGASVCWPRHGTRATTSVVHGPGDVPLPLASIASIASIARKRRSPMSHPSGAVASRVPGGRAGGRLTNVKASSTGPTRYGPAHEPGWQVLPCPSCHPPQLDPGRAPRRRPDHCSPAR
jgi:hypothetical protein